jgi:hypothetical protein
LQATGGGSAVNRGPEVCQAHTADIGQWNLKRRSSLKSDQFLNDAFHQIVVFTVTAGFQT